MIFFDKDRILYSDEESLLYCGNDIGILYKDAIKDEIENNKYGKVIKTMLKSIKYID